MGLGTRTAINWPKSREPRPAVAALGQPCQIDFNIAKLVSRPLATLPGPPPLRQAGFFVPKVPGRPAQDPETPNPRAARAALAGPGLTRAAPSVRNATRFPFSGGPRKTNFGCPLRYPLK